VLTGRKRRARLPFPERVLAVVARERSRRDDPLVVDFERRFELRRPLRDDDQRPFLREAGERAFAAGEGQRDALGGERAKRWRAGQCAGAIARNACRREAE